MQVKPEHVARVYAHLLTQAREGKTIIYKDLAPLVEITQWGNYPQQYLAFVLGHISEAETTAGRPMLTAIVVNKDTNEPGAGFWKLATEVHRFSGSTAEERTAFWTQERNRVFATWRMQSSRA